MLGAFEAAVGREDFEFPFLLDHGAASARLAVDVCVVKFFLGVMVVFLSSLLSVCNVAPL